MGNFINLPNELKLDIIKNLSPSALENFSHCSKNCYNLALPMRFKCIILNAVAIKIFGDGGVGAEARPSIHSIRFGRPGDWRSTGNLNQLCSSIMALGWFHNLQKLSVSYSVPSCMERNVFMCLLDRIDACSGGLKHLQIEVFEVGSAPGAYQVFYGGLSKLAQNMLGPVIDDANIWRMSMKKSSQMSLPVLDSVKILHSAINTPLHDFDSSMCRPRGYYYTVFAMGDLPRLRTLAITTDTHFGELAGSRNNEDLSLGLLAKFSRITDLEIKQPIAPTDSDIEILVSRFPNLRKLLIKATASRKRELGTIPKSPYGAIIGLLDLVDLALPWPTHPEYGLMLIEALTDRVEGWAKEGLDLKRVAFEGDRKIERVHQKKKIECLKWDTVSIYFVPSASTEATESTFEVHGDTSDDSYEDFLFD
ncbi:hypothetical protein TWF506_001166 [Arthrobotrys conoides]|uniref:F-box domain-containing protein n=1 Tax=Arthrobotrys conoides TaxID=74498 RepID=A0AAN8NGV9_9PEZI